MWTSFCLVRVSVLALLVSATPALAAPETPTCDAEPSCRDQVLSVLKWAKREPKAALNMFEALHAKFPDPRLLYNIARMQHQLGQHPQAAESYRSYLNSGVEIRRTERPSDLGSRTLDY